MGKVNPKFIMIIYVIQVLLNWAYVIWVSHDPNIITNAWFTLIPFFGFFYFAIALYALLSMYYRMTLGLGLALVVLFFGVILTVLSYELAYQVFNAASVAILPLIILNFFVIFFMAYNKDSFKGE